MFQLRDLAHDGRTIIVVTHTSPEPHGPCDRLLVSPPAEDGLFGPPGEGARLLGLNRRADLFQAFDLYL